MSENSSIVGTGSYLADDSGIPNDAILPSQFFAARRPSCSGELRLALEVLVTAIDDLQGNGHLSGHGSPKREAMKVDARAWIAAHGTEYPYSFDALCEYLSIDTEGLRTRLLAGEVIDIKRRPTMGDGRILR
jgi:hypothetical protein